MIAIIEAVDVFVEQRLLLKKLPDRSVKHGEARCISSAPDLQRIAGTTVPQSSNS